MHPLNFRNITLALLNNLIREIIVILKQVGYIVVV